MNLEEKLGYFFFDKRLLKRALTRPAFALEQQQPGQACEDQEPYVVLGDAVLSTVLTELLIRAGYTTQNDLIAKKAELESQTNLASISEAIGVSYVLKLGSDEKQQRAYEQPAVLAEGLQALMGGVYLDGGFRAARECIYRLFQESFPPE
jgi:ribonuclease-3